MLDKHFNKCYNLYIDNQGWFMSRSPDKVFNKTFNTKSRRTLTDYDYLDKLNQKEKEWLARFTEEYYAASFDNNPAYMKKNELIDLIITQLNKTKGTIKHAKWQSHLERVLPLTDNYIQISENEKKSDNFDLRKFRKVDIYYINENGNYVKNKKYKYSDTNIIDPNNKKDIKECNDRVNTQSRCILNTYREVYSENVDIGEYTEVMGPEDYYLLNEELLIREMEDKPI